MANCTAGARQLVANGIPQDQIHLIYNAVDPTQWQDPATTLRQEIGAEAGDFVLLFAARLVEGKGHAFLLESLAQLRENTAHPFRLVLSGEGPLRQDLEAQTQALGLADRVTFLGFRSDMSNLYHGADLTLCPSESETLSLLLLESLACGTPVLATRVGGIPDIVTPAHDVGCLVDYGRPGRRPGGRHGRPRPAGPLGGQRAPGGGGDLFRGHPECPDAGPVRGEE